MNMRYALRSEDTEQINVVTWCRWQQNAFPELKLLHHCPNGGSRNEREAVKFKQMGVLAGVSDLHLPAPKGVYASLYIEMKYGDGRLEDSQKRFLRAAADVGNYCAVCYDAQTAINVITEYLQLKHGESMKAPNAVIFKGDKVKPIPEPKNK
jgi:hypothetical protein